MGTHIHLSGLSYFCTDEGLRQAFIPFGTVVLARVLRDEWGHSLGLGIVHMACTEDVERVFNEHQSFDVSGSRVDLWEPAELEDLQGRRILAYDPRERKAAQRDQDKRQEKSQTSLKPLAVLKGRLLIKPSVPSSRTAKH